MNKFNEKAGILILTIRDELKMYYDESTAVDPKVLDGLFGDIFKELCKIVEEKLKKSESIFQGDYFPTPAY